jgi:aryl-alcohol dehydrogenase-like predicted oxidoreductase
MQASMQLVLGTVQFGVAYGVAGRDSPVPEAEVRAILARAWSLGVRILDTAAAYGDIEQRLVGLAEGLPFGIVTKLPPVPPDLGALDAADWAASMLDRSRARLGERLRAVMFHRAEDLLGPHADALWGRCTAWTERQACLLGVSCYDVPTLNLLAARFGVRIAQLPGNALDQRVDHGPPLDRPLELHIRSAFLQGLLLMPQERAAQRVPASAKALDRWHGWVGARSLDPLQAALGIVKGLRGASHCVVGVDSLAQLEAIATAWDAALPTQAPELAIAEPDVIDPRRWTARP